MNTFKSLKKPPLSKEVEEILKESITNEIYKLGDKLPSERELVDQFQVSRSTIRQALMNLQLSGLINIKRGMNAGAYVSELKSDPIVENFKNLISLKKINIIHLLDARLYIEPEAARVAAMCRTGNDIDKLAQILVTSKEQAKTSCLQARLTNLTFHCEVAKMTKNPIIFFINESILRVYSTGIIEMTERSVDKKTVLKSINEHRNILNAILEQNTDEAFEYAKQHIIEVYHVYRRVIPNIFQKDSKNLPLRRAVTITPLLDKNGDASEGDEDTLIQNDYTVLLEHIESGKNE